MIGCEREVTAARSREGMSSYGQQCELSERAERFHWPGRSSGRTTLHSPTRHTHSRTHSLTRRTAQHAALLSLDCSSH